MTREAFKELQIGDVVTVLNKHNASGYPWELAEIKTVEPKVTAFLYGGRGNVDCIPEKTELFVKAEEFYKWCERGLE